MAKKLIQRITKASLPQHVQRYLDTKKFVDEASARLKTQRDSLIEYVADNGTEDDKGHVLMHLPGVAMVKRERRSSRVLDEDFAEQWLKDNGLWDDCSTTITVLDEDALVAKIYNDEIPQKVSDKMYSQRESFALKVTPE